MNRPARIERGNVFIVTAPSGTGKSTLVHRLLAACPKLSFSVSHTTRKPRVGERHGQDYFFVGEDDFRDSIDAGAFLEYAEVHGHLYGTAKDQVERALEGGVDIILDIDIAGACQVKSQNPLACAIFILPPDYSELRRRLEQRAMDAPGVIERRLANAVREVREVNRFDFVLVNDDLDACFENLQAIYRADRFKTFRRQEVIEGILESFVQVK